MSNLGKYQWITTASKKVGGPVNLLVLTAVGGFATFRLIEAGGKFVYKKIKSHMDKKPAEIISSALEYTVVKDGTSNENIKFSVGEKFCILEKDGDSVLINKIGDTNSPYFVSKELLKEISEYDGDGND